MLSWTALTIRAKLEIGGVIVALVLIGIVAGSLSEARKEAAELKATLQTQGEVVADASKRELTRDSALKVTVAKLEEAKKRVQTPPQVVAALQAVIPLPKPLTLNTVQPGAKSGVPGALPDAPSANIPAVDLKPLYDFGIACQECKAQLSTLQADRADDAAKLGAVTKERDAAVQAAKGGSKWQRIKRSLKYLGIGAVAGAVAVCASGHCK